MAYYAGSLIKFNAVLLSPPAFCIIGKPSAFKSNMPKANANGKSNLCLAYSRYFPTR
jgi:hypothetical protein